MASAACNSFASLTADQLGGASPQLLKWQKALAEGSVVADADAESLAAHLRAIDLRVSQRAQKELLGLNSAHLREMVEHAAGVTGLEGLSEHSGGITATQLVVAGTDMGTMYMRSWSTVLFYLLRHATPQNFSTAFKRLGAAGAANRVFAGKLSLDTGAAIVGKVQGLKTSDYLEAQRAAGRLKKSPLLIGVAQDKTTRSSTSEASWTGIQVFLPNFDPKVLHLRATTALLGFMPNFDPAHGAEMVQLATHQALDLVNSRLYELRRGLLWELGKGEVHILYPVICCTVGDHPWLRKQNSQMTSARARSPCTVCLLTPLDLTTACTHELKPVLPAEALHPHLSIAGAAAVPPRAPPGSAMGEKRALRRLREAAKGVGGVLMGRTPAPFTRKALAISSPASSDLTGALGLLHVLGSLLKHLSGVPFEAGGGGGLSQPTFDGANEELKARVLGILAYRGPASYLIKFRPLDLSRRVPTKYFRSISLLLPGLLAGLVDDSALDTFTASCFALHRLSLSLNQDSITGEDVTRITYEARVVMRRLRVHPSFSRRIITHMALHYGERIPLEGPPRHTDEAFMEGYNYYIKLIATLCSGGEEQERDMLRMRGHLDLASLLVDTHAARGAAGAHFPPTSLAGQLCTLAPPLRPAVVACDTIVDSTPQLPGFVSASRLDPTAVIRALGGRKAPGAKRCTTASGVPLSDISLPLSLEAPFAELLARELALKLVGAPEPPAGGIEARKSWRRRLTAATATHRWPTGYGLLREHFTAGCELTPAGARRLVQGGSLHVHDAARFADTPGAAPTPALWCSGKPFVSYSALDDHPDLAGDGTGVAVGQLLGIVTVGASAGWLLPGSSVPRLPEERLAILRRAYPCPDTPIPALERDLRHPMLLRGEGAPGVSDFVAVSLPLLLRREHVQHRYSSVPEEQAPGWLWWYPQGGAHGVLQPQPFPADEASDAEEPKVAVEEEGEEEEEEEEEEEDDDEEDEEDEEDDEEDEDGDSDSSGGASQDQDDGEEDEAGFVRKGKKSKALKKKALKKKAVKKKKKALKKKALKKKALKQKKAAPKKPGKTKK